ncbi:MAG TPA: cobalt-precorrin-7 (C(5))-methyltransferase [Methanotrichaceae archaeon]|nr:cobalt-precorrin-7 (C(5))-methyltransferase [Methanotrichaceae archaeon]
MKIIGVGAGPGMLTYEAARAIKEARLIRGSKRAIDLVREKIDPGCDVRAIENYRTLRELPPEAVVLSTGDPMLSGLGYLDGEVVPGISSMQVACARLKVSQLKVVPISVHGRNMDPEPILEEVARGKSVFLLVDDSTNLTGLFQLLEGKGLRRDVAILIDLGYPEEEILRGTTANPPHSKELASVMIGDLGFETTP